MNQQLKSDNSAAMLQALTQLVPMFTGASSKKTQTTSGGTQTRQTLGDDVIAELTAALTGGGFTKQAAQDDSQASINAIVQQLMQQGVPQIASGQVGTGAYNQTASKLLMDNLKSQAAAEGAKLQQQTIKDYAGIQSQLAQNLKGAKDTVTTTPMTQTTTGGTDPMIDPLMGLGGLAALFAGNQAMNFFAGDDESKRKSGDVSKAMTPAFNPAVDISSLFSQAIPTADSGMQGQIGDFLNKGFDSPISQNVSNLGLPGMGAPGEDLFMQPSAPSSGSSGSSSGQPGIGFNIGKDGGGVSFSLPFCFITTAVCKADNKPDDCYELTTLRHFRDTYMNTDPKRALLVQRYYDEAPAIVQSIESMPAADKEHVYSNIRDNFIMPAIVAIEEGMYATAAELYTNMFYQVRNLAARINNKGA